MNANREQTIKPLLVGLLGLLLGLLIGLFVLGWGLFPVQWTEAAPVNLMNQSQVDYLRAGIDSFAVDFDSNAALQRYQELGPDGPAALATIQADPGASPTAVAAYSTLLEAAGEDTTVGLSATRLAPTLLLGLCLLSLLLVGGAWFFFWWRARNQPLMPPQPAVGTPETVPDETAPVETAPVEEVQSAVVPEEAGQAEAEGALAADEALAETEGMGTAVGAVGLAAAAATLDDDTRAVQPAVTEPGMTPEPESAYQPAQMAYELAYIEGIGPVYAQKLNEIGIANPAQLLERGATPHGRQLIAEQAGLSGKLVLTWVNHVDLYRIKGVGSEYAELLEAAGVDTVVELAQRVPAHLHQAMLDVNQEKNLVRRPPVLDQVADWIEQAKTLPRVITY